MESAAAKCWLVSAPKKTQLSLELRLNLANAVALGTQFANTSKLRQRLEVVAEFRVREWRALDDALFSPAANRRSLNPKSCLISRTE